MITSLERLHPDNRRAFFTITETSREEALSLSDSAVPTLQNPTREIEMRSRILPSLFFLHQISGSLLSRTSQPTKFGRSHLRPASRAPQPRSPRDPPAPRDPDPLRPPDLGIFLLSKA